ncbi:MAG: hypothetical protein O7C63_04985 [Alphaproteobacteria bacterium]|nr:hypothetical protein [Alphaproteobacteria bacterium]
MKQGHALKSTGAISLAAALFAPAASAHPHHDIATAVSHSHGVEILGTGLLIMAIALTVSRLRRKAKHGRR